MFGHLNKINVFFLPKYENHILTMWAIKMWYMKYDTKHKALKQLLFVDLNNIHFKFYLKSQ